ncbi:HNH endonuclease [Pseudarthrobacter sp. NPDC058119]|uniref:HNH endonuclease n=1 Tax=Pseudarthrobacter sp. NPDC058119 TaxID=3346348 RepID=UPI0036D768CB
MFTLGKKNYPLGKVKEQVFEQHFEDQMHWPMLITIVKGRRYWQFKSQFYWESEGLEPEDVYALLVTKEQVKKRRLENARSTAAIVSAPRTATARQAIPNDVRTYIWERDKGTCVACGSTNEIQFDHIIPLAKGGSNNVENLELLCGPCNRSKSAGLTVRRG